MTIAALVWGAQGAGKSLTGLCTAAAYGKNNFSEIGPGALLGTFNEEFRHKQFIVADEVVRSDRRADAEKLKVLITRQNIPINVKHKPLYTLRDTINFYLTSNSANAVYLDGTGERRFFIHHVEGKLDRQLAREVAAWIKTQEGVAALLHFLMFEVDVSAFDPFVAPPLNADKLAMIGESKSDLDTFVSEAVGIAQEDGAAGPAPSDLTTAEYLAIRFEERTKRRPEINAVKSSLRKTETAVALGQVRVGDERVRVWALANTQYWQANRDAISDSFKESKAGQEHLKGVAAVCQVRGCEPDD